MQHPRSLRFLTPLALVLTLAPALRAEPPAVVPPVAPTAPAPVQTPAVVAEARAALDAGRIEEACKLLEAGLAAARVYDVLLAAGQCHELLGKTATAFAELAEASSLAEKEGASDRQDRARAMASKLAPRVPKLRIDVLAPHPEQVVKRDGIVVDRAQWGALQFIDPGAHAISASAPNRRAFSATVVVGAEGDVRVVLVPELIDVNAPEPLPKKPVAPPIPPAKGDGRVESVDALGITGFVTTSFGALGIAMGTVFGVMTLNDVSSAEDDPLLCPNKVCSKAGRAVIDEAETKGIVATVSFVVGGVSLATGITVFLVRELAGPKAPVIETKGVVIEPLLSPEWSGVRVRF